MRLRTDRQTDTQTRVTTIHCTSSTTHTKCNKTGGIPCKPSQGVTGTDCQLLMHCSAKYKYFNRNNNNHLYTAFLIHFTLKTQTTPYRREKAYILGISLWIYPQAIYWWMCSPISLRNNTDAYKLLTL